MRKIVFALIAVLLIGTFVACDGEADFLLWDDEPAEKVLTLEIQDGYTRYYYSFDKEGYEYTGSFKIDGSVTTWTELKNSGNEVFVYYLGNENPIALKCCEAFGGKVFFESDSYGKFMVFLDDEPVQFDSDIDFSKTYKLAMGT